MITGVVQHQSNRIRKTNAATLRSKPPIVSVSTTVVLDREDHGDAVRITTHQRPCSFLSMPTATGFARAFMPMSGIANPSPVRILKEKIQGRF